MSLLKYDHLFKVQILTKKKEERIFLFFSSQNTIHLNNIFFIFFQSMFFVLKKNLILSFNIIFIGFGLHNFFQFTFYEVILVS
jgi:hypothetical protein